MANETVELQIKRAWEQQRGGQSDAAVASFEKIIKQDNDNIDAHYGLGISRRSAGQHGAALESFERALDLTEKAAKDAPSQEEQDRYLMLKRMLNQRIAELDVKEN